MSQCNIDHSLEDVKKKLASQKEVLREDLYTRLERFLQKELDQEMLNTIFHLLKKYDLASPTEREERNKKLLKILA